MDKISVRHRIIEHLPVLEVVAENKIGKILPLVIYYHGWRSAKELVLTQARKIAAEGIRVILPDAKHHGERDLVPVSTIPSFTFWGSIQANLAEFNVFTNFFIDLNLVKADQIGVGGVSMGGMTTAALLTQHPEIKAAACIMGSPKPVAYRERVLAMARTKDIWYPADLPKLLSWIDAYDLSQQVVSLAGRPLYFWHGTDDDRVPFEDTASFIAQHHDDPAAKGVTFTIGQGEGHLVQPEEMTRIAAFFAENLVN